MLLVALMAILYGLVLILVLKTGRTALSNGRISIGMYRTLVVTFAVVAGIVLRVLWSKLQEPL